MQIGISVHHQGHDPSQMSFRAFRWPEIGSTIPTQNQILASSISTEQEKTDFFNKLQSTNKKHQRWGIPYYGPFNHITDLLK